ncbi:MAG: hypothetical protein EZS28_000505 [Streblomastix strix]|uniref:Uncharacterized protein n=1 Tax=Streblomastix strix TaxID=222440 RepID=A0A5J4XBS3_9EUKA|nr:MAG: hypothetical protein EZS28_000505 [Streblomastix strix]
MENEDDLEINGEYQGSRKRIQSRDIAGMREFEQRESVQVMATYVVESGWGAVPVKITTGEKKLQRQTNGEERRTSNRLIYESLLLH